MKNPFRHISEDGLTTLFAVLRSHRIDEAPFTCPRASIDITRPVESLLAIFLDLRPQNFGKEGGGLLVAALVPNPTSK